MYNVYIKIWKLAAIIWYLHLHFYLCTHAYVLAIYYMLVYTLYSVHIAHFLQRYPYL